MTHSALPPNKLGVGGVVTPFKPLMVRVVLKIRIDRTRHPVVVQVGSEPVEVPVLSGGWLTHAAPFASDNATIPARFGMCGNAVPAHAMFSILPTQSLQSRALDATAQSVMDADEYDIFSAVMAVVDRVKGIRNRLAHWVWGVCQQRPEFLILADPKMLKARDRRAAAYYQSAKPETFDPEELWSTIQFDDSGMLAYSQAELEGAARDLHETEHMLTVYGMVLDPSVGLINAKAIGVPDTREGLLPHILAKLNEGRLFSDAIGVVKAKKNHRPTE